MVDDSGQFSVENSNGERRAAVYVDKDGSLKKTALHWLFGQPANTTALYLILACLVYAAWYLVTTGIPAHLAQIHQGYEAISRNNNETQKEIREAHTKEMDKLQTVFEKAVERYEKAFTEGFRARGEKS